MKTLMLKNIQNQSGAVLVMALLMLFVLTLIGVSSINTTTMEEKMSGNSRNHQLAFHAAEMAIREAEDFITNSVNNPTGQFTVASATTGLYATNKGPSVYNATDKSWWGTYASPSINGRRTYAGATQDMPNSPQYTIEYQGESKQQEATDPTINGGENIGGGQGGIAIFRITARGTGLTENASVVIQSHFGKRI